MPITNVTADNVAHYGQPPLQALQLFGGERRILEQFVSPEMRVLDLGSGSGRVTRHLLDAGASVWACDLSASALHALRRSLGGGARVAVFLGDASRLPVADCSLDLVIFAFNGIDFLHPESERFSALEEIGRVLRPGGYFVFSTHNPLGMLLTLHGVRSWALWRWRLRFALSGMGKRRYFRDANGLLLYQAAPRDVIREVSTRGPFRFLQARSHSGRLRAIPLISLFSAWPSYVFMKERHEC